jgi:hypothetical protein
MINPYCKYCNVSFEQVISALLVDLECRDSNPTHCHVGPHYVHEYVEKPKPPAEEPD